MGEQTKADVVSMRLADGEKLTIEALRSMSSIHRGTPTIHTASSCRIEYLPVTRC
jgi:hypothetical protein